MTMRDFFDSAGDIPVAARELAAELGLEVVAKKPRSVAGVHVLDAVGLQGHLDGQPFYGTVAHRFVGSLYGTALVACDMPFAHPMWVDLSVTGRHTPSPEFQSELDSEYVIRTRDERFTEELLRDPLQAELLACNRAGYRPSLTDSGFVMTAYGLGSRRELREFFRSAVQVSAAVRERRKVARRSRLHEKATSAWLECAQDLGATLNEEALTLTANMTTGTLVLSAEHPAYGDWRTSVAVEFEPPLPGELRITTVSRAWERWFTSDIHLGDPEFDKRFLVKASSREYAERVLSPGAQSALLAVANASSELLVTEKRLLATRTGLHSDQRMAKGFIEVAVAALDELTRLAERRGAYR